MGVGKFMQIWVRVGRPGWVRLTRRGWVIWLMGGCEYVCRSRGGCGWVHGLTTHCIEAEFMIMRFNI